MSSFPPTLIIRHRKENLKKCSLRGLEKREDLIFVSYPLKAPLTLPNFTLLTLNSREILSKEDNSSNLLLLDGTWRYAQAMESFLSAHYTFARRRLPPQLTTAYPRRQQDCTDPNSGLASLEALACAYALLGRPLEGLLDHYHWREAFLEKNHALLNAYV